MSELPIIVLAFANEQEGRMYLRDLPDELRGLQNILKEAERNGLCRLELLPNATLDQIFDVFTRNRDQVTILHYAGHADSGRLLLESSSAGAAPAHAAGLATFLGQCGGLQLVFLNGCSTRAQVARLLEAGVASVIATARAIDDGMAREFAVAFYTELAAGLPLRAAYETARGRILAAHDSAPEAYYGHRDLGTTPQSSSLDPGDDHGFPWEFRTGTELVERWSLPDAAGNPEFGLPRLPEHDLPERPFRNLSWFAAEHADVFFGRGYQVRELFQQLTDPTGPPILLLYGASGVGKSSLMDAGLSPRMEAGGNVVRYCRRDPRLGLARSLRDALKLVGNQTGVNDAWRAEEARVGKPLCVFLDQVEEVFTHPDPDQPRELDEFVVALQEALGSRDTRPKGKLVLGFRKEWLAEFDRWLAEAKLPRNKFFLKPLDRRGIIEAICGPARPGRLKRQYRLAIEDGLPEVIADNLLADAGSALAPTLQVLLTNMWDRARRANPDQPVFDRALFEMLKAGGYLLKDVLDEGVQAIGGWCLAVEQSGLALDVLVYHTTEFGTASEHTRAELSARYAHQVESLDGLLGQCKDHYLIIDVEPDPNSSVRSSRLAHDLLAPLVQQRFRLSVAPGQRARRVLENRVADWADGKTGPVLDRADLGTVLEGAAGMRSWTADEVRLVETSRQTDERERAEEAEQLRRIREAEEGQRQAETLGRQQAQQHLKLQERANLRLRHRAYALGSVLVLAVVVAVWAVSQWRQAKTANTRRAIAQADELLEANPQAVHSILEAVRSDPEAMEKLRLLRSRSDLPTKKLVRASLALARSDPSQADFLLGRMLEKESDPDELLLIRDEIKPHAARLASNLWDQLLDPETPSELRLRQGAALAAFASDDPRWETAGSMIIPILLSANPFQQDSWTAAFRPVKNQLLKPLFKAFAGKSTSERKVSALILHDYTTHNDDLIHELLKYADEYQYRIFLPSAWADPRPAVNAMREELAKPPRTTGEYGEQEMLAARKANAVITLAHFGETDSLWPALKHEPDPRVRTYLIQRLVRFGIASKLLAERFSIEREPSVRAALLLALAENTQSGKPTEIPSSFADQLVADYANDPDPEFHSAAFWLLRKWGRLNDALAVDRSLRGKPPTGSRGWYVNREAQTFVVIRNPKVFAMGSPPEENALGRNKVEKLHHRRIPRSFAICTREVTVDEFKAFLADPAGRSLNYKDDDQRQYSPAREGPIVSVTWFEAAKYCRWLSEREGIAKDQQCFPEIVEIQENMTLPKDYLSRTGYRLPTEAEWEYACRAGTETPWSFGSGPSLLDNFACHVGNSSQDNLQRAVKTRLFKPNALGLFDMHGNVSEWCFDRDPPYPDADGPVVDDREQDNLVVLDKPLRMYRGGSFGDLAPSLRSAYRDGSRPTNKFPQLGFRIARTIPR